jgi:hypothetical protein
MRSKKANMHRGEALQIAVSNSGLSITKVVKRAGYSRSSYYIHITDPKLAYDIMAQYSRAINHDFSDDFPEMARYLLKEDEEIYGEPDTIEMAVKQRNNWRDKYYFLLEKYQKLLEEKIRIR